MAGGGFLSLAGSAAAADLGIGANPAMPQDLTEDEIKRRKKQLDVMQQAKQGTNNMGAPGPFQGASLSLLGQ